MKRFVLALMLAATLVTAQTPPVVEQEPPEEDKSPAEKQEYTLNPLQAAREMKIGNFYFRKGSFRAAARRFEEATKWDPNSVEAWMRLGDTQQKLGDEKAARQAWVKALEVEPDGKYASELRKKTGQKR